MTALSVVIPAYNEEDGIAEIASRVLSVEHSLKEVGIEQLLVYVVDDGSQDRTAEIAASIEGVHLIQMGSNGGYGAALKKGFASTHSDLIGFLDADGTYPPEYFPALCAAALDGADLVVGSRMSGTDSQMPATRRVGNLFFARLLSIVGQQAVSDSASGMRVFRRHILDQLYPLPDGLNLTPVMSTKAIHEGIAIAEVPIPYSERLGRSKLSVVNDGTLFLQSILWANLQYNPVRILGLVGLTGMAIGAFCLLGLILARLAGVTTLGPLGVLAVYVGAVAGMVGVNVFVLGVIFNYLVSLLHKRPIRQGLFGKPILKTPLDKQFWWMGLAAAGLGLAVATVSFVLGVNGWETNRLWLYALGSAMLIILGIQLVIYWIIMRVLDDIVASEARAHPFTVPGATS